MNPDTLSIWNPLEFVEEFTPTDYLDIPELLGIADHAVQIAHEQSVPITFGGKTVGREVGDDRVDLNGTTAPLLCTLAVQEDLVHMVTSQEDTSIRKKSWNFCEVTSGPITDPSEGFDYVRKDGNFENLGFNDSVILRIISDVQKGNGEEHSSTPPGKMSMLGSRLATPRRENRGTWMIASMFQDAMLCTHKATEPKYLPQQLGGTGVTALFDNPNNVFLYVLSYKGGTYRRIYATAVAELREYLYALERGVHSAPILAPRLREKQEYFWGTYDHMVFVPDHVPIGDSDDPPAPLYKATGGQNRYQNFENRLLRTRHVVTRRQANVEWAHTRRLRHIFQSLFPQISDFETLDKDKVRIMRAKYDGALYAHTALQNLLRREATLKDVNQLIGDKNFYTLTVGKLDFNRADADWVYLNGQTENFSLNDVTLSEDIFVRDEVSAEETFKVGGIPLKPIFTRGEVIRPTRTKVGLYQINMDQEEWSEDLTNRLIEERSLKGRPLSGEETGPIFDKNPEWVSDDSGLIARCHRLTSGLMNRYEVCLVSDDRRLANQMAETCNVTVIRVRTRSYVLGCALRKEDPQRENFGLVRLAGIMTPYLLLDTGSILACAARYTEEDDTIYRRILHNTGWEGETRFSRITLEKVKGIRLQKEVHYPIQRPKKWRAFSRPSDEVYSSHSSWKRSSRASGMDSTWWRSTSTPMTARSPVLERNRRPIYK